MSLLRLTLAKAPAKLKHLNTRTEKQGKKGFVPAADLRFELNSSADILASFSPTLKDQFFDSAQTLDLAGGMALRENNIVYPVSHSGEMSECGVIIGNGVAAVMELNDAKVNAFKITPIKGGSVKLEFRIQCRPDEKQAGALYMMQESEIELSIEPPSLADIEKRAAEGKGKKK